MVGIRVVMGGSTLHCQSSVAFDGPLGVVVQSRGFAHAAGVVCSQARCLSSSVVASGAVSSRLRTLSSRRTLCGMDGRLRAAPVSAGAVEGPASAAAVVEDMSLAHDGGGRQGGDGSGELDVLGAGDDTGYETGMETATLHVVMAEVGAEVLDVKVHSMLTEKAEQVRSDEGV